ncbi:MAG: site-specific integrase [Gemmatimonadota bacterium]
MPFKRGRIWRIDIKPVGYPHRIAVSCRWRDKKTAEAMETTVRQLALRGRHDVLDALRAGEVTLPDLHEHVMAGTLKQVTEHKDDPPLEVVIRNFHRDHPTERHIYATKKILQAAPKGARLSWLKDIENLRELLRLYRDRGLANNTILRELQAVSMILRDHYGEGGRRDIMADLSKPRADDPRDVYLEPVEIQRVLKVAGEAWALPINLTIATGLRRGEMLALKVGDIDFAGAVVVRKGKTRAARRRIPLYAGLVPNLRRWIASQRLGPADLLFPGLYPSKVQKAWKQIREQAAVPHVNWHDLRHTFGVACAKAGVPMPTLKTWLGHANLRTTMIYAAYEPGEKSERYQAAMGSFLGPNDSPTVDNLPLVGAVASTENDLDTLLNLNRRRTRR